MAASIKMVCLNAYRRFLKLNSTHKQITRLKRNTVSVYTTEEEIRLLKRMKAKQDPKKNAYLPFEQSDPVQKNLVDLTRRKPTIAGVKQGKNMTDHDSRAVRGDYSSGHEIVSRKLKATSVPSTYIKLEDSDKRFGRAVIRARSKKERAKSREVVLEGRRLILDALGAGGTIKELYFSGAETLDDVLLAAVSGTPIYKVTYKEMKIWSDVDTPQGILGIFEMPPEDMKPVHDCLPITLIFDQIRDPGNFGTLLRTAAAVGCQKVIAVKGCVDAWSPKVLRSGAGSHYRVPIMTDIKWTEIDAYIPEQAHVFIADNRELSEEIMEELAGRSDIVNELDRLETKELYTADKDSDLSESGSETDSESDSDEEDLNEIDSHVAESRRSLGHLKAKTEFPTHKIYKQAPLNVCNYEEANFVNKHSVIIIGGETEGISVYARKLAYTHYGQCVTIPMMAEVESLNCSIAGSIVLFEASKQFRHTKKDDFKKLKEN